MFILIATTCPICHVRADLEVPELGYEAWKNGTLIQDAMPELTMDQREQLMTGFCIPCWNTMFAADPEAEYVEPPMTDEERRHYENSEDGHPQCDEPQDPNQCQVCGQYGPHSCPGMYADNDQMLKAMEETAQMRQDYQSSGETEESLLHQQRAEDGTCYCPEHNTEPQISFMDFLEELGRRFQAKNDNLPQDDDLPF
jgi:hypothetical protein